MPDIYHGSKEIFTGIIDPAVYSKECLDFGPAIYFSYDYESARKRTDYMGYVLTQSVADELDSEYCIGDYHFNTYYIKNFGDYDYVASDDERILDLNAGIYIGPRADQTASTIIGKYIHDYGDYYDDNVILDLFADLDCYRYTTQIAFTPRTANYLYEVYDEHWTKA